MKNNVTVRQTKTFKGFTIYFNTENEAKELANRILRGKATVCRLVEARTGVNKGFAVHWFMKI